MLDKGTKVRVLGGAFAGRVGVVSELDGKGFARVALGLMTAKVALQDLTPATEGPMHAGLLRSSHWRPDAPGPPLAPPPRAEPGRASARPRPAAGPVRGRADPPAAGVGVHPAPTRSKKMRGPRRGPQR